MLLKTSTLLLILAVSAGCGTGTQSLRVEEVSYQDLFRLTAHIIDQEGFVLEDLNSDEGYISTRWDYNKLLDVGRFPLRRRAEAQIDPDGEGAYLIHLTIDQEALRRGYGVSEPEKSDDWEEYGYDKQATRTILTRIKLLTRDFEPSTDFYNKYKKKDELEKDVPEVLESDGYKQVGG
jgi:hypothetical protein